MRYTVVIYRCNQHVCLTKSDMFSADKTSSCVTVRDRPSVAGDPRRSVVSLLAKLQNYAQDLPLKRFYITYSYIYPNDINSSCTYNIKSASLKRKGPTALHPGTIGTYYVLLSMTPRLHNDCVYDYTVTFWWFNIYFCCFLLSENCHTLS